MLRFANRKFEKFISKSSDKFIAIVKVYVCYVTDNIVTEIFSYVEWMEYAINFQLINDKIK
ncbi:hypothetical protein T01_2662 [Trichinella spiralis]|uniref:Uncharacterized protein n=1 Tax=Trichinella spiralis TaxID=6334 RepID=A0A0V1B453_TRISP|nr:hypothetical protein T01_2662 [Trichinella spiralis]